MHAFEKLFTEASDSELCSGVVMRIIEHYGDRVDPSVLPKEDRVILLTWHAAGIIGNGGFNYLFEGDYGKDPYFAWTAEAFEIIGCGAASEAFQNALSFFPGGRPPTDRGRRLTQYRRGEGSKRWQIDGQFFRAHAQIVQCLASYIRSHRPALEYLGRPSARPIPMEPQERPKPTSKARRTDGSASGLSVLPHWARIAFAARCARRVFPLFSKYWPNAGPARSQTVLHAIELAESSAAKGRPADGLRDAWVAACTIVGAALVPVYGMPCDESTPSDGNDGSIAASVAKAAEQSLDAVQAGPENSVFAAHQAFTSAVQVADADEAKRILNGIRRDFARLLRAARKNKWTDKTPVSSRIFGSYDEGGSTKPWWRFW